MTNTKDPHIEATDEMIDAACDAVPGLYRVDAMKAIEAALLAAPAKPVASPPAAAEAESAAQDARDAERIARGEDAR